MFKSRKNRKKRGITTRWIAAILMVTVVILASASVVIVISVRQSYYSAARQVLDRRVSYMINRMSDYPAEQRGDELSNYVETFSDSEKDKFEMMLVNEDGRVIKTSSGYAYGADELMEDVEQALWSEQSDGKGSYIGYSANGEHIVAVTQVLRSPIGETAAVRYVSSLVYVDKCIMGVVQATILVSFAVLMFSVLIGLYFIRSIVVPIGKIGQTASRIADGDFEVRVENVYNDEIGELCDTINNMAAGLSVSDRLKNEFISSVSHELRTPLTAIKGWGETIQSVGTKDEKVLNKGIDIIISETERLSYLVEDLLDFSRLQSGSQMKFAFETVDIVSELHETVQIFERRAESLGLLFSFITPKAETLVSADKNRMRQVFSNLIDNAIKYSRIKDTITVAVENVGAKVHISISDKGIGIPDSDMKSITERFYKASNSLTGSGIGLAVVKEIVVKHDGELKIDSTLGKGTTVTVILPLL